MNHKDKIYLTKKLHEIMCGLSGKDIALVASDPPGRTDTESYIALPIEDPDVDIIHRHEWSHILFGTNLHAREEFMERYLEQLKARGMQFDELQVEDLIDVVSNALDDVRVLSLQELVYPGSASRIRARWARMVASATSTNYVLRIIGLGIGMSEEMLPASVWERFDEETRRACLLVVRSGYVSVLLATRLLFDSILDYALMELEDQLEEALMPAPVEPARRLSRTRRRRTGEFDAAKASSLLKRLAERPKTTAILKDTELSPNSTDHHPHATQRLVQAAMGNVEPEQLEQVLSEGRADVQTVAVNLRRRTQVNPDNELAKDLGRVTIEDLPPSDVEEFRLSSEDQELVDHLHQVFVRLRDVRDRRRTDEGSTLDPERYIDFMLGHGDQDFFVEDLTVRGFVLLLLVDMSGSMAKLWTTVSRAAKVAACSTHFPFSHREFWAFSGAQSGETVILRFQDPEKGYLPKRHVPAAWGLTPLHVAMQMAVRRLRQFDSRARHLLVVTDGNPQQIDQSPTVLRDSVTRAVRLASQTNVAVSALVVGGEVPDEEVNKMFGRGRWKRIEEAQESLFYEMLQLVRTAFTHYLRR
jgi:VWA domain containing CoxE-like protein